MGTHINTCPVCEMQVGNLTHTDSYKETSNTCADIYACKYRAKMISKLRNIEVDLSRQEKNINIMSVALEKLTKLVGHLMKLIIRQEI